ARDRLQGRATGVLRCAAEVLAAAADVGARLDRLVTPVLAASVDDARAHLCRLTRPGFVKSAGEARLADVVRYVRGIERRLAVVAEDVGRDRRRMSEVGAVERRYTALLGRLATSEM